MGLAWNDRREWTVLLVIAKLDEAGQYNVTAESISEFVARKTIELGPLPAGASVPSGLDATQVQVLLSLDALQWENPPYITAFSTQSIMAPFPDGVFNIRLTARGSDTVAWLREASSSGQRSPIGFQPPQQEA